MALTMRPTGLGHGVYKGSIDYSVFSGEWEIGRIYERKGFPDDVRFFWSLHGIVLTRPPAILARWCRGDARSREGGVRGELEAIARVGNARGGQVEIACEASRKRWS
jgi:hypothetical protein